MLPYRGQHDRAAAFALEKLTAQAGQMTQTLRSWTGGSVRPPQRSEWSTFCFLRENGMVPIAIFGVF